MSSTKYACELVTDKRLERALIGGGILAWLAGGLLLLTLPAPLILRWALLSCWTASSWLELLGQWRGTARLHRIRVMADGRVEGIAADGRREMLELLSGSMVLASGAWLRLRFPDGCHAGEWLMPREGEREQWHMLQLIWRQRAGCFGRLRRS